MIEATRGVLPIVLQRDERPAVRLLDGYPAPRDLVKKALTSATSSGGV
jgi:hypothetical protein